MQGAIAPRAAGQIHDGGTNDKQFWIDRQAVFHSLAPPRLGLVVCTSIFSLCGIPYSWKTTSAEEELGDACIPEVER